MNWDFNHGETLNTVIGYEKLAFLFLILFIGIILSLIAIIFELKLKPNQRNGQEEVESSSKEIDKLEKITRQLLEGPLQENTEKCLKRLLDEYTGENKSYLGNDPNEHSIQNCHNR